ncbi:MAG: type VII secretion integral membrane protein EccD [Actinomycetota bacterium]|nr:type VII secretion integral membrane protein EccD [Actinomycetota bacterium]
MSRGASTGLARVTIAAPRRRVDVALPEHVPTAELLPGLLRAAGDGLADQGQEHGGWVLRKSDGTLIDAARPIGTQELRDGDVLHLMPRQAEWPEMDYDDVVDAIATDARRQSRSWGSANTRRAAVAVASGTLLLGLAILLTTGPNWQLPGGLALGLAVGLLAAAVALSRALGDAGAGAVLGSVAMVYAFAGGVALSQGDQPLLAAQAPQYLAGCSALFAVGLLGYLGVADRTQYFVAGIVAGLLGFLGALIALIWDTNLADIAAILVSVVVVFTPTIPLLSIRLGKLPMPSLPTTVEDLLADPPVVPLTRVHATVRRSDELLSGMLIGGALIVSLGELALVSSGELSGFILVAVVGSASLLRGRLFPAVRHRAPLLVTGVVGLAALAVGMMAVAPDWRLSVILPVLVVVAAMVLAAGFAYQNRPPSPYVGRIADILDILLVVAVVPVACAVLGLYGYFRGLGG